MSQGNLLGDDAVRQLSAGLRDIQQLKQKVQRLGKRAPRTLRDTYVEITELLDDNEFAAKQVIRNDTNDGWDQVSEGLSWGDTTDDVGRLYSIRPVDNLDMVGETVPLMRFSDGTSVFWGFEWFESGIEPLSFDSWFDPDTSDMVINDGYVFQSSTSGVGAILVDGSSFPLGDESCVWVEMVSEISSSQQDMTATMLDGTEFPDYMIIGATDVTVNWPLSCIVSGEIERRWTGDIHVTYPFTPSFYGDIQGGQQYEIKLPGVVSDSTITEQGSSFDSLIKLRMTELGFVVGGLWDSDDLDREVEIGGATGDGSVPLLIDVDTSTEDELRFKAGDATIRADHGLVQELELAADGDKDEIIKAIKWLGIEPGGIFVHRPPLIDSTNAWGVLAHDGTNWSFGGATGTDMDATIDIKGHWGQITVDGTDFTPPDATTFYRYEHCTAPGTFPDLIFESNEGAAIAVSGNCYFLVGDTEEDPSGGTVDAVYTDCSDCISDQTNKLWTDCDTESDEVVYAPTDSNLPPDDFAYVLFAGAYKPAKEVGNTGDAAGADPCSVEDPSGTPTQCSDIVPEWFSDAMDDSSLDTCRLTHNGTGTAVETSVLTLSVSSSGSRIINIVNNRLGEIIAADRLDGDFSVSITWNGTDFAMPDSGDRRMNFYLNIGGTLYGMMRMRQAGTGDGWRWLAGTYTGIIATSTTVNTTMTISRVGTTVTIDNGDGDSNTYTKSGVVSGLAFDCSANGNPMTSAVEFSDLEIT